jgi:hypothetical protein
VKKGRDDRSPYRAVNCPACGGQLAEATRTETGVREHIVRCMYCSAEYDRRDDAYYRFFNEASFHPAESLLFMQGSRGDISGKPCEITGRVRYLRDGKEGVRTRDEWHARTDEGGHYVFVERGNSVILYEPFTGQVPPGVRRKSGGRKKHVRGPVPPALRERVLYIEGITGEKKVPGTLYETREKKKSGEWFLVRSAGGSETVLKGKSLTLSDIVGGFRCEPQVFSLDEARKKGRGARAGAAVYVCAMIVSAVLTALSFRAGKEIIGLDQKKLLLGQREVDAAAGFNLGQALYGPFEIRGRKSLCGLELREDGKTAGKEYTLYYRMALLRDKALSGLLPLVKGRSDDLKRFLEETGSLREPVESYVKEGAFTAGSAPASVKVFRPKGSARFVVDEPGDYYVYLEVCGARSGIMETVRLSCTTGLVTSRYFAASLLIIFVLFCVQCALMRASNAWPARGGAGAQGYAGIGGDETCGNR